MYSAKPLIWIVNSVCVFLPHSLSFFVCLRLCVHVLRETQKTQSQCMLLCVSIGINNMDLLLCIMQKPLTWVMNNVCIFLSRLSLSLCVSTVVCPCMQRNTKDTGTVHVTVSAYLLVSKTCLRRMCLVHSVSLKCIMNSASNLPQRA